MFLTFVNEICMLVEHYKIWIACAVTTVCGLVALRRYMAGGVCKSKAQLQGKTVLITGANTGIGKGTARDIARRGARVLLACRDITKAERAAEEIRKETNNTEVVVYMLDLASLKSVRQCAEEVKAKEARLDILINNAGVMWTPGWKTEDGFEMTIGVNHLGHFLLTNLLLDLLKKSAPSRIVTVSSIAYKRARMDFDDLNGTKNYYPLAAYRQSKLANVLFTRELSKRLKGSCVTANSLHPGVVDTEIARNFAQKFHPIIVALGAKILQLLVKPLFVKSSMQGAQTTIHCAVAEELEGVTGKYFSDCAIQEEASHAKDDEAAARLWRMSEQMVGLQPNL